MTTKTLRSQLATVLMALAVMLALPLTLKAQSAYIQHTVEAQETLYGIARRFGITIDEVVAANPGLTPQGLKRGQVIRIPTTVSNAPNTQTQVSTAGSSRHVVQQSETIWGIAHQHGITVEALRAANPVMNTPDYVLPIGATLVIPAGGKPAPQVAQNSGVRIALVMPTKAQREEVGRCKEFYHGLLLAAEELKQKGHAITIYAYEEDPNDGSLADLQSKLRTNPVDIIYGPLYPNHFPILAEYAKRNGVRLIVPFSSKVAEVEHNPSVYVVNTPNAYRNDAAADVITRQFGSTHLVVLHTGTANEAAFVEKLKAKSAAAGGHSTTLPVNFTDKQILEVFAHNDRVVFVPNGSKEADYQAVIKRLDRLRSEMPLLNTSLLAYPDWQKYQDKDHMIWYACDTYLFCPEFYNPYDDLVKVFVRKYRDRYQTDLQPYYPRYGVLGYDVAMQTMSGFFTHKDQYHGQETSNVTAVQSHLRFKKTSNIGGYVNTNIWLMHFKKSRTIDLIGVR